MNEPKIFSQANVRGRSDRPDGKVRFWKSCSESPEELVGEAVLRENRLANWLRAQVTRESILSSLFE
jgi:hypothetical protein